MSEGLGKQVREVGMNLDRLTCFFFGHQLVTMDRVLSTERHRCVRCSKQWAYHNRVGIWIPWDEKAQAALEAWRNSVEQSETRQSSSSEGSEDGEMEE